jgi:prepilin-type N-terminal cleavage/methylation domain-containing protein
MKQRGFSLIELLIVVAIILVIAAIAIPNMLKSRMSANEASAISSVRAINNAQMTYSLTYPDVGFADNLSKLGAPTSGNPTSANAGLLDWVLGCTSQPCPKSGYNFSIVNSTGTPVSGYEVHAVPQQVGQSGQRGFCSYRFDTVMTDLTGGSNCTTPLQ